MSAYSLSVTQARRSLQRDCELLCFAVEMVKKQPAGDDDIKRVIVFTASVAEALTLIAARTHNHEEAHYANTALSKLESGEPEKAVDYLKGKLIGADS